MRLLSAALHIINSILTLWGFMMSYIKLNKFTEFPLITLMTADQPPQPPQCFSVGPISCSLETRLHLLDERRTAGALRPDHSQLIRSSPSINIQVKTHKHVPGSDINIKTSCWTADLSYSLFKVFSVIVLVLIGRLCLNQNNFIDREEETVTAAPLNTNYK